MSHSGYFLFQEAWTRTLIESNLTLRDAPQLYVKGKKRCVTFNGCSEYQCVREVEATMFSPKRSRLPSDHTVDGDNFHPRVMDQLIDVFRPAFSEGVNEYLGIDAGRYQDRLCCREQRSDQTNGGIMVNVSRT